MRRCKTNLLINYKVYSHCSALLFLNIATQGDAYLGPMLIEVLHLVLKLIIISRRFIPKMHR